MNRTLYNIICYAVMVYRGDKRLDKAANDIPQLLVRVGFVILCILAFIGLIALCFYLVPPSYFSTPLA